MSFYFLGGRREIPHACGMEELDRYGVPKRPDADLLPPPQNLLRMDRYTEWSPLNHPLFSNTQILIDNTLHGEGRDSNQSVQLGDVIAFLNHTFPQDAQWRVLVYQSATMPANWVDAMTITPSQGTYIKQPEQNQVILQAGFRGAAHIGSAVPVGKPTIARYRFSENLPYRGHAQQYWHDSDAWWYMPVWNEAESLVTSDYNVAIKGYEHFVQVHESPWQPITGPLGVDSDLTPGGIIPEERLTDKRSSFIRMPAIDTEKVTDLVVIELDTSGGNAEALYVARPMSAGCLQDVKPSWLDTSNRTRAHNGDPRTRKGSRRRRIDFSLAALDDAEVTAVETLLDVYDGSERNPLVVWRVAAGYRSYTQNGPWTVVSKSTRTKGFNNTDMKIQLQRWD